MATATYVIEWDQANDGTFVDITGSTMRVQWRRGRDRASQLTGRSQAGRCSIVLNNTGGTYSPFNSSSPLAGSLLPGRKMRIRTTSPTAVTLWTGYIDSIVPSPRVTQLNTVTIEGIGPLGFINQEKVKVPMLTNVRTDVAIGTILDQAGWDSTARDLATGQTVMTRFWVDDRAPLGAMREVEYSENGFIWEKKTGEIAFDDRHTRLTGDAGTSQATFTDSGTGTLRYVTIQERDPLPFIFNIAEASVAIYRTDATATLWHYPGTGADSPYLAASSTLVFWGNHPNPTSSLDVVGVDSWITPVLATDWKVFENIDETGTNVGTATAITTTEFAEAIKIELNNTGTQGGYVTQMQVRGVPLTKGTVTVSNIDATSTAIYGPRRYPAQAKFIPIVSEAEDAVIDITDKNANPTPVIAMQVLGNIDGSHLTQVLTRDINDRITVTGTGSADLGVSTDFFIESENHVIDARRTHTVTWELSDASVSVGLSDHWLMGTSNLGTNSKVVY